MKNLSKLGLTLLALALPLVTSSANAVEVDNSTGKVGKDYGMQECTQQTITDYVFTADPIITSDGPATVVCTIRTRLFIYEDCTMIHTATSLGCDIM